MLSDRESENEAIHAALKASELAKKRRSHVAVHFAKIAMVREIDRIQADANLVPAPTLHEWQMQMKISIILRIKGKESPASRYIPHTRVILDQLDFREG